MGGHMYSKLVELVPVFSHKFEPGQRVYFKLMSKKGRIKSEGFGTVDNVFHGWQGMPYLTITGDIPPNYQDNEMYPNSFVYVKASDVLSGKTKLLPLGGQS
ncbi:hypothetical protein D3C74_175190 [compost metagenome]